MPQLSIQESLSVPLRDLALKLKAHKTLIPSQAWKSINFHYVRDWEYFNLTNLRNTYNYVFDMPCSISIPVQEIYGEHVVQDKDELKHHGIKTLDHLLKYPLRDGIPKLRESLLCSKKEVRCDLEAPHCKDDWRWAVFYALRETNLVVSCSRLSTTFTSKDLHLFGDPTGAMRELATYAANGRTRYCFILTDKEVVIVRFHTISKNDAEYGAQWKAIPWNTYDKGKLMPALAVYSLVLMSLYDFHRHIACGPMTLPLTAWIREKGKTDGRVTCHHYLSERRSDVVT